MDVDNTPILGTKHCLCNICKESFDRLGDQKQSLSAWRSPYCSCGRVGRKVRRPERREQGQKRDRSQGWGREKKPAGRAEKA